MIEYKVFYFFFKCEYIDLLLIDYYINLVLISFIWIFFEIY